jgi:hypothetical protein
MAAVQQLVLDEKYTFKSKTKTKLIILIVVGIVLAGLGILIANSMSHGHDAGHGAEVAKAAEHAEHHGSPVIVKRILKDLWQNNIFFGGIALVGVFFIAFNYVAHAGWGAAIKRVPEAFGNYLFVYAGLTIVLLVVGGHDLFHWMDHDLFDPKSPKFDEIISSKSWYLNVGFFWGRTIGYFVLWILFWWLLRQKSKQEDSIGGVNNYDRSIVISAGFLIIFGVTSSTSAWDWVMSMDPHFFSTMFGWYVFASMFVSGLAMITLVVINLKKAGYLALVNENHLHDLGKFMFAFSIFWTYVWFEQFLLIYYANIPEESYYFVERLLNSTYSPFFFAAFFINFLFPFLTLMPRESKRQTVFLEIVAVGILIGHWLDFYVMMTPPVLHNDGALDITFFFIELGITMVFLGIFLFVINIGLTKAGLIAKNHPMLEESIHHHVY